MSTTDTRVIVGRPRRRKWSKDEPPLMRIVLLGKSASESSLVGNFILGRSALDSEAPPDVVERVGGRVRNRHVTLINSPHLLQTDISEHQITQTLRECVSLSDPGPHVIVLVLNPPCSAGDGERLEQLRDSLSDGLFQHSLVISTREPTDTDEVLQEILQRCSHRHFSLQTSSSPEEILQMCEEIQRSNSGRHLECVKKILEDSQEITIQQQDRGGVSGGVNLVVCGSDASLKPLVSELILTDRRSVCVRTDMDLHTHLLNLLDLPALVQLSEQEVMRASLRCVSLCHPGVHLFLLIIPDTPLNNEDRAEMEAIQRIFSSRIHRHMMILIMQSSERQTAELSEETQAVLQSFGGRHHFIGPNTHVSTLMEKIEEMLEENRGDVYSTETFLETQMEKLMKYEEMKKKIDSLETHLLPQGSREETDELRIVLLGKTGVGKSATGNTILGRVTFKAEASFDSVTRESQKESSELNGRRVTVIDTPGLFDTELSDEEIRREITHCVSMILPGPHVFLLLIPLGRFTKHEEESVKILQETFGEKSVRFTMVLFTRGDDLKDKTLEQCLGKPGSAIRKLTEACGNRVHVFNNNQTGDPTQVYELLEKIDNMVEENGGSFYSCKMFREMERERQERQMKILMDRIREREEEMRRHEEEKERMKKMMEEERQNQDEDRKRREEELKREIREEEKHQREIRDEMRHERETFRHEIEEMRREKEKIKTEKDNLKTEYETEIERIKNIHKNREKERNKKEEEFDEREEQYKTLMKDKEEQMKKLEEKERNHEKKREEEFREMEERYKAQLKEKEEREEQMCEEMKREREEREIQRLEEKMRREEEDEKRREEEQRLKQERERWEREKEDLQSKHEEEENKMKILMEEMNREREEEMKRHEEEKERMKRMMEEDRQNQEERKRREEELKSEIREKEKHQREIREDMRRERETFRHEREEIRGENEKIKTEKDNLKTEYETEIERFKNRIESERENQETERKRREEEFNQREEQYKRLMKEKEERDREIQDEMRRERETFRHEIEEMRKEKEKMRSEKVGFTAEYETEINKLKNTVKNERENHDKEKKRREEEFKDREEQHKTLIKEKEELMTGLKERNDEERKRREEELKDLEERYKAQLKEKEEREEQMCEEMKREREEREKQKLEEKKRREEEEEKRREREKQIQRLQSEMEEIIEEKERIERERQTQVKMREDEQKSFEEKLKLIEDQHKDELKRRRVEWREEYKREKEEEKKSSLQGTERTQHLFHRLHLEESYWNKLRPVDVLQINQQSLQSDECCAEDELVQTFIQKLLMMNYSARNIKIKEINEEYHVQQRASEGEGDLLRVFTHVFSSKKGTSQSERIHPMDVQMAVFHCSDFLLKQMMVTKLSQCQFALPLLVPDPDTQQIEFPLWTFRQITKSWKIRNTDTEITSQTQPISKAQTPMVFFFRFGPVSSSKSQLMNSLINEKHNTFFHRNCPGSSRTRVLMDGVVEIAWFCPSGTHEDRFNDCVAFCNLHGNAGDHEKQLQILTEMASVNVVLLPRLNRDDTHAAKIQDLFRNRKPLICVLTEDGSTLIETSKGKFKIGLKDRNQSDVSEELRKAINDCLSESSSSFRLEDMSKHSDIRVDEEDDEDCRRGRAAAQQMMSLLENKDLTEIKESFLPHQGKLWHQWSQKNKELHRPRGDDTEREISRKRSEMEKIRKQQHECNVSKFMQLFIKQIDLHAEHQMHFVQWLRILLDEHTSAELSKLLHIYDEKWTTVLKLKQRYNKLAQLRAEQTELERISVDLQSAAIGVEHIMREISQIYESCESVKENKKDLQVHFSSLPSLAAQMMISGFPLELMDGDAANVPVVWISAVLDQLVQKLGDQRVFVLSVLGIQSSGKSTMLNAMFGLQFPVSAGRCTRGAFMQLVKVSEEMKTQINIDYILVVDTEGLRALELAGRSTRDHDNELATFVVGLGNLTLINIFGENPSEMQDVLQIVVQAFLRMKKVRLNPRCVFVHQNVSDVTAGEKNMEGRRRLLEKLDEMTKLAAKDEVCDAECFSDVIRFDVQKDVKYFAQLWEGSPPMAPPNPNYCENIQDLKKTIIAHASISHGLRLKDIKDRVKDLWEALLNEQFIFYFRNSLEISAYRNVETEYSKWSWSLRSAMMETENKLHNQIEYEAIDEVKETDLQRELKRTRDEVTKSMSEFFEKDADKDILIQWKVSFEIKIKELQENIVRETKRKLNEILQQRDLKKKIDAQRTHHENTLYEKSKKFALKLKNKTKDNETLKKEFDLFWEQSVKKIISDTSQIKDIDVMRDVREILIDIYKSAPLDHTGKSSDIFTVQSYSDFVKVKKYSGFMRFTNLYRSAQEKFGYLLSEEDEAQIRSFVTDVSLQTDKQIQSFNISKMGYNISYIQQLTGYIKARLTEHEEGPVKYVFKNEFFMDLVFSIFRREERTITDQHRLFREANDPVIYVEKKREEYYSIFQKYCHRAASAAVFGEIICQKLKEPIEQSVYKKTSRDLADEMRSNCESLSGNRSNLEKHILKTLAEEEDFDKYMECIHNPRDHFKSFITDEVSRYITDKFSVSVSPKMEENIKHLQQKILRAAHESTEHVQLNSGDVHLWLKSFTQKLSDELIFSEKDLSGVEHGDVEDFRLLEDVIRQELTGVISEIKRRFSRMAFPVILDHKFRPDEFLIDHFCRCCWVQCPFCKVLCTNTIENHDEDHSAPFHRVNGLSGFYYDGTQNLCTEFCSTVVMSNKSFKSSGQWFPFKHYRNAGGDYSHWRITPDFTPELSYWKWFVCRFQRDLENFYCKPFSGSGTIPYEWRNLSKRDAIESLDKHM